MMAMTDTTRSNTAGVVVWGLPRALWIMVSIACAALPIATLYGVSQSPDQVFGWLALVGLTALMVFTANMGRRSCTIDGGQLRCKGRFATRTVDLSDLRQAAIGFRRIWVQTHHPLDRRGGTVLCLRMIPTTNATMSGYPIGQQAVELIRARAAAAGAKLDPPLTRQTRAPSRKPLIFSI
jgi:hypothetical protein